MTNARELLPCPFPHEITRGPFLEVDTDDFGFVRVSCADCGCAGPPVNIASLEGASEGERKAAITAWNTRQVTQLEAQLAEMRSRLTLIGDKVRQAKTIVREDGHNYWLVSDDAMNGLRALLTQSKEPK